MTHVAIVSGYLINFKTVTDDDIESADMTMHNKERKGTAIYKKGYMNGQELKAVGVSQPEEGARSLYMVVLYSRTMP